MEPVLAHHRVSGTQWCALDALAAGRATTAAELADDLDHDRGAMSRLVDGLEGAGWASRTREVTDRRVVRIELTAAGAELVRRVRSDLAPLWRGLHQELDGGAIPILERQLGRLLDALRTDADSRSL